MREPDPANYFAAKYSLPHAAAALVLRGNTGYHAFTEDRRAGIRRSPRFAAASPCARIPSSPRSCRG